MVWMVVFLACGTADSVDTAPSKGDDKRVSVAPATGSSCEERVPVGEWCGWGGIRTGEGSTYAEAYADGLAKCDSSHAAQLTPLRVESDTAKRTCEEDRNGDGNRDCDGFQRERTGTCEVYLCVTVTDHGSGPMMDELCNYEAPVDASTPGTGQCFSIDPHIVDRDHAVCYTKYTASCTMLDCMI